MPRITELTADHVRMMINAQLTLLAEFKLAVVDRDWWTDSAVDEFSGHADMMMLLNNVCDFDPADAPKILQHLRMAVVVICCDSVPTETLRLLFDDDDDYEEAINTWDIPDDFDPARVYPLR